jgi:DNA-binding beta-propeller fold protein YncE
MNYRAAINKWLGILLVAPMALLAAPKGMAASPTLEKVQTIELKGPAGPFDHLMLDHKRSRLLVANQSNNTLDVVDLKSGKMIKQVPDQKEIHGIDYSPELDRVFVGNGEGKCNALDGENYTLLKSHAVADADNVHCDTRTNRVYVASEKELAVIDGKSLEQVGRIKLPSSPEGFQIDSARQRLFVNTLPPNQVTVVNTANNEAINHYALPGRKGLETLVLDEKNKRIFVGLRGDPMVIVLDRDSGREIAQVTIPDGIDDMSFDPNHKYIYCACAAGWIAVVQQLNADHYELVAKVPTAKGAKTCCFDAESDRLYLAVPRQKHKHQPEVWVYRITP